MRKRFRKLSVFFIILLFLISGCGYGIGGQDNKNKYSIDVYYKPEDMSIFASQNLLYTNSEGNEISALYFNLYANAFHDKETSPMIGDIMNNYPEGFNTGQIDIISVTVNNKLVEWEMEGKDRTVLCVNFVKPLKINEKASVKIEFQEKLPHARTDFGSYNGIACFENWYPVLCVYDEEGWHKEPGCNIGEVNFSEISDYVVDINLPEDEVVASTGKCVRKRNVGSNRNKITIKANNVRDFTWISSRRFKIVEKKDNGVSIKSYFLEEDKIRGLEALDYASRAVRFFSQVFGEYPYDTFSVVETYLYGGAMEYPMLTSVGEQFYKYSDAKMLEGIVAHETAHQWWYVVVGNNEYREPWLDEAMATYSEALYFEKYYGREVMKEKINWRVGLTRFDRSPGDCLGKFKTLSEYNLVVYVKGAYILDEFRRAVGDERYFEVMRRYYSTHMFVNADIDDFLDVVRDVCGEEAVTFIKLRLSGGEEK